MSQDMHTINPDTTVIRKGEYARNGDFHTNLDPNWSYYPIYINKMEVVDDLLRRHSSSSHLVVDAGCGEGTLVERYARQGWNIQGFDKNYGSQYVKEASLLEAPYRDDEVETLLCLDVIEHLVFTDQNKALTELHRILKPGGYAIFSMPNLAHLSSRFKFMFRSKLLRTASISHHPGDRPTPEYLELLASHGFEVLETFGIFPTLPVLFRYVRTHPSKCVGLLRFLRRLPFPVNWNFQVLFLCRKPLGT